MKKTTYGAKLDTSKIKCLCRDQRTHGYISYTMHQAADSCKYYFLLFSLGFVTLSAFTSLKTQQGPWLAACFRKDHPASVSMANDKSRKWYIPWTEFCKYTHSYAYLWNLMKCSVRALPHYSTVTHHMFLPRYRRKIEAPTVADTRQLKKPVWVIVCVLSLSVYLHSCLLSPNASSYWWSLAVWLSNIRQLSIDYIDPFSATDPYCEGSGLRRDPEAFLSGDATLKLVLWSSTESTVVCLQRALFSEGGSVTTGLWPLLLVLLSLCQPATKESKTITLEFEFNLIVIINTWNVTRVGAFLMVIVIHTIHHCMWHITLLHENTHVWHYCT